MLYIQLNQIFTCQQPFEKLVAEEKEKLAKAAAAASASEDDE